MCSVHEYAGTLHAKNGFQRSTENSVRAVHVTHMIQKAVPGGRTCSGNSPLVVHAELVPSSGFSLCFGSRVMQKCGNFVK